MARGMEQLRHDMASIATHATAQKDALIANGFELGMDRMFHGMKKNVIPAYNPVFAEGFEQPFQEKLDTNGVAVGLLNHEAHADGFGVLAVAQSLIEKSKDADGVPRIKGFFFPIAYTISTGDQKGKVMQDAVERMRLEALSYGVDVRQYMRKKDELLLAKTHPELIAKGRKANMELIRLMLEKLRDGWGVLLFPEGTVEGGRKDIHGSINGMQPFQEDIILPTVKTIQRVGKQPFYIPIAVSGSNKLQDVNKGNKPTPSFLLGTMVHEVFLPDLSVSVGDTVWHHELTTDPLSVPHQLGHFVSEMLPPKRRGFYGDSPLFVD